MNLNEMTKEQLIVKVEQLLGDKIDLIEDLKEMTYEKEQIEFNYNEAEKFMKENGIYTQYEDCLTAY